MAEDRIYVQIPAYRDAELPATLLDLYARAARPDLLRTCLVWQRGAGETLPEVVRTLPGLEIVEYPAEESQGCNWARRIARAGWREEPYTLLLDSHHRFVDAWDELVLGMYAEVAAVSERPLLTSYLPPYDPELEPLGRGSAPYKIYPMAREDGILVRLTSFPIPWWQEVPTPLPGEFLSLHFAFAAGRFNAEVPIDDELYFFGDEVVLGMRAYTMGYDLYAPHRIVGWHAYSRKERVPHWDDHADWHRQHLAALAWMRELFADKDALSLPGQVRTLADYERHIMTELVTC
jgi:hypothetical protein